MTDESTGFDTVQSEGRVMKPAPWVSEGAWISSMDQYQEMYDRSVSDPEGFWADQAKELIYWEKPWDKVLEWEFETPKVEWYKGGKTNVSYNCLDRHLTDGRRNKAAIIWESDEGRSKIYTYQSLYDKVCRFANVLKKHGIKKGDRVAIYMPMIPELASRNARVRANRCDPLDRLRRVLARARCAIAFKTVGARCLSPRMRASAAGVSFRSRRCQTKRCSSARPSRRASSCRAPRTRSTWSRGGTSGTTRRCALTTSPPLRHRVDGCRGPAVHPLHVRLDGQAQGRAPHHRRIPGLHARMTFKYTFDYHEDDVFLLHGGHRLDYRSQLRRLRRRCR